MLLDESHDEMFYRSLCTDLAFESGVDIFCEGGEAMVRADSAGAVTATLCRPVNTGTFWEETWFAFRGDFGPQAPPRIVMPAPRGSTPSGGMGSL